MSAFLMIGSRTRKCPGCTWGRVPASAPTGTVCFDCRVKNRGGGSWSSAVHVPVHIPVHPMRHPEPVAPGSGVTASHHRSLHRK